MTNSIAVSPRVHWIGVDDRTSALFEGLWPIADTGVSYNSYLVRGERTALIDLVHAAKFEEWLGRLTAEVPIERLDYIVVNHMEPDHTGALPEVYRRAANATVLCTEKARGMLDSFFGIRERVRVVCDGETVPLGGATLRFSETPFVHWPETMMTFVPEEGVLFSCDGFGGYGALNGILFDDEARSLDGYEREALRYYTNIVARFSKMVRKAVEKLAGLPIRVIAPSHGLVWRRDPERILALYRRWASYADEPALPEVTLVYGSMYGNTEAMMRAVARGVAGAGVALQVFKVGETHPGNILPSLWTRRGVIVGAPTYEGRLFPPMVTLLQMAGEKAVTGRDAGYFGSYGWHGGAQVAFQKAAEPLRWKIHQSVAFCGAPTQEMLEAGEALGQRIGQAVQGGVGDEAA